MELEVGIAPRSSNEHLQWPRQSYNASIKNTTGC